MPTGCRIGNGVIESSYTGVVTPEELERAVIDTVRIARESGVYRFLADVTGLTGGHSASHLFGVVELLERLGLPRTLREAIVVSPEAMPKLDVQFYEDACRNRGWNVRLFSDRAAALAWLGES